MDQKVIVITEENTEIGDIILENTKTINRTKKECKNVRKVKGKKGKNDQDIEYANEYTVERIINKRQNSDGTVQYRIKWCEYDESQNTWENVENIFCSNLIAEFENKVSKNKELEKIQRVQENVTNLGKMMYFHWNIKALRILLSKGGGWVKFSEYKKARLALAKLKMRIRFLERCSQNNITPTFLKFRIPQNGKFTDRSVWEFQRKLLLKELTLAKNQAANCMEDVNKTRGNLKNHVFEWYKDKSYIMMAHIANAIYNFIEFETATIKHKHEKKLQFWGQQQNKPIVDKENTIKVIGDIKRPPKIVIETLKLGPRNPVLTKFDEKEILCEMDLFLEHCESRITEPEIINDLNSLTHNYIKRAKRQKQNSAIRATNEYLKKNNIKAVPMDKGLGFVLMSDADYQIRLEKITKLNQFKREYRKRKNEKDPIIKEEERIIGELKKLEKGKKLDEKLYKQLKPTGSQSAKLYGLAKVHKEGTPLRPIVSIPGTPYDKIGKFVSKWLENVSESKINTSTGDINKMVKNMTLQDNEKLISYDVCQLYTNVPLEESIEMAAVRLFQETDEVPVDINTFMKLCKLACSNILIETSNGFIRQVDGLAMGIQCAPQLANIWLAALDKEIQNESRLYCRYMDDVITIINTQYSTSNLARINKLHPNLTFTSELENEKGELPFLDMLLIHKQDGKIDTQWYRKPTDTGLVLNFHALAPFKYKKSVIINMVHRVNNATNNWENFHRGIEEAKEILRNNHYPPEIYEDIIRTTIEKIVLKTKKKPPDKDDFRKMFFINYRGTITDHFIRSLYNTKAPIKPIITLKKVKQVLPPLKVGTDKSLSSNIVYDYNCSHCKEVSYTGMTERHFKVRISEHKSKGGKQSPIRAHTLDCYAGEPHEEDFKILRRVSKPSVVYLAVMEALYIRELKPVLNTKDEFKGRMLRIKI